MKISTLPAKMIDGPQKAQKAKNLYRIDRIKMDFLKISARKKFQSQKTNHNKFENKRKIITTDLTQINTD